MNDKYLQLKKDVTWEQGLIEETLDKINKMMAISNDELLEEMQKPPLWKGIKKTLDDFFNKLKAESNSSQPPPSPIH